MKQVFQMKVAEKEAKMRQNEEEVLLFCLKSGAILYLTLFSAQLYAKHRELRESIERQRAELEEKKRRLEGGEKKVKKSLFK